MNYQPKIDLLRLGKFLLAVILVTAVTTHIYQTNTKEIWLLDYIIPNKAAARITGVLLLFYAFKLCIGANNFVTRIIGSVFDSIKMSVKNN